MQIMENNTYFYSDLIFNGNQFPSWYTTIQKFSKEKLVRVYLLRFPITDTEHEDYKYHFILLIPGCKISIIKESDINTDFETYKEDIKDTISYLYQKYNYRSSLGPIREIVNKLLCTYDECINDNFDIEKFYNEKINLQDEKDKRYSKLLVSLCIGSINDIKKVGAEVPNTLLDKIRHKIQIFDGDQTRFIYNSKQASKTIRIQGLSGTGKTELLLHKLKELYTKNDEVKIFFTCHNRILATELKNRINSFFNYMKVSIQLEWNKKLWCENAWGRFSDFNSGLYRYICHHYKIKFQPYLNKNFEQLCKETIEELEKIDNFTEIFDYIIVDESQDFGMNFVQLCEKVTKNQVYLAGDIFQSIFENNEQTKEKNKVDYLLNKCYRTAPDTLMFAHALCLGLFEEKKYQWLDDASWESCGYTIEKKDNDKMVLSREPVNRFDNENCESYTSVEIKCCLETDLPLKILELLNDLKTNQNITTNDIAIIFIDDNDQFYLLANKIGYEINNKMNWNVNKAYETKQIINNQLLISNKNNIKGLEFPYVICITNGLKNNNRYRNVIYTLLTRSFITSYLFFVGDYEIPKEIQEGLKNILATHKMEICIPSKESIETIIEFNRQKQMSIRDIVCKHIEVNNLDSDFSEKILELLNKKDNLSQLKEDELSEKISQAIAFLKD